MVSQEDSIMQIVENIGNIKLKGDAHHLLARSRSAHAGSTGSMSGTLRH